MSVRQVLGQLGDWSITLKPETPGSIRQLPVRRDQVVIVPGYVTDSDANAASLFALSRYSGVVRNVGERLTFGGDSILGWLGDGDSPPRGPLPISAVGKTFTQLVNAAIPSSGNGLSIGTAYSTPATVINADTFNGTEATRPGLDRLATYVGAEWRVNADRTVDHGAPGSLWKSGAAIDLVLTAEMGGVEADGLHGLRVDRFTVTESGERAVTFANITYSGGATGTGAPIGYGADGATFAEIRYYETISGNATDAGNRLTQVLAQRVDTTTVSAEISAGDVGRYMTKGMPGDWVYVYDLETGLVDTAASNPPIYRGQQLPALQSLRIVEADWPVSSDYSVFHIASAGGTNTVTNLTPYVVFETGTTRLTLATLAPLTLRKAITGNQIT